MTTKLASPNRCLAHGQINCQPCNQDWADLDYRFEQADERRRQEQPDQRKKNR